jgi:hypothetical protein
MHCGRSGFENGSSPAAMRSVQSAWLEHAWIPGPGCVAGHLRQRLAGLRAAPGVSRIHVGEILRDRARAQGAERVAGNLALDFMMFNHSLVLDLADGNSLLSGS